jgi:RimJ/RimL family protein N-acetyltransferase
MTLEREIIIEGNTFKITVSDDQKALCSAYAEGRAVIGLWDRENPGQCLTPASYVVESLEDIDDEFLERVVRRREDLPWLIANTGRLTIREFTKEDCYLVEDEPDGGENGAVFLNQELLRDYIRCQYGFYEYGIWAILDNQTGRLVGKAGIFPMDVTGLEGFLETIKENDTPVELGYHIFSACRRNGYASEACKAILSYAAETVSTKVYARIQEDNLPSVKLAEDLGFKLIGRTCSGLSQPLCLYEWNWS